MLCLVFIHQPHIGLMHQGSGLQRVVGPFASQVITGDSMQILIDLLRKVWRPFGLR